MGAVLGVRRKGDSMSVCVSGVVADQPGKMHTVSRSHGPDHESPAAFIGQFCIDVYGLSCKKGIRDPEAKADIADIDCGPHQHFTVFVRPVDDLPVVRKTPHLSSGCQWL